MQSVAALRILANQNVIASIKHKLIIKSIVLQLHYVKFFLHLKGSKYIINRGKKKRKCIRSTAL